MKPLLTTLLFFGSLSLVMAQGNLRFSYTVSTSGSTSTIMLYVQNSGPGLENMTSYTMNLYHDNTESTITNFDMSPTNTLGWLSLPSSTVFNPTDNPSIPILHNGFGNINVLDFFGFGTNFDSSPTHILTITVDNSPGTNALGEFYLSSSSEGHPEQVYNDNGAPIPNAYPVIFVVNNPAPVITGASVYCEGTGGVVLDAGAGFASYLWSTGETTQSITALAGSFTVTVTNGSGGSGISDPFVVTENANPTPVISGPLYYCEGTNGVTLDAGTAYASYSWSPNGETTQTITATAGVYAVLVVDTTGCSGVSSNIQITENANPLPLISGATAYCEGSGGSLLDAGIGYVNYLWSPTGEMTQGINATAGTYTVTVTDGNGCTGTSTDFVVTENANPTPPVISGATEYCPGGSGVSLDAGAGVSSYIWSTGETTQTITALAGSYAVTVLDTNACSSTSASFSVSEGDAVPPVPDVDPLPDVTDPVSVTLVPPTASDNCAGTITATTSSPATITTSGTTVVSWTYNDGNGNSVDQLQTVIISGPSGPSFTAVGTDESCDFNNDGSIQVTASGGSGNYDFSNDNGATWIFASGNPYTFGGLDGGPYVILVRDAANPSSQSTPQTITIGNGAQPSFTASTLDASCSEREDGSIDVTAIGNAPFSFSIEGGPFEPGSVGPTMTTYTNLGAGEYLIQVQDANGCLSPTTLISTGAASPPSFDVSVAHASTPSANDGTITLTVTQGTPPFQFSKDGGNTFVVGTGNTYTFSGLAIGLYDLKVKDANDCASARVPAFVSGSNFCPSPSQIDVLFTAHPTSEAKDAKFICEDLIPMLTYNIAGLSSGTSFYFDWQISDIQGKKNGHYPTYNGAVPATDGSVGGTEGPVFTNGDHFFDMDGGVLGVQDLSYGEKRISVSVLPYLINIDGTSCPANPDVWKLYVYPRPEAELDNATAPGTGIVINSGDDPSGLIEIDHVGKINENNGLFVYDLHIDPNPDIAELTTGLDQYDAGAILNNNLDKEFEPIDLGLSSLTNTSNAAVSITVEVTPNFDPDHARAASKDPVSNPNGYCAGDVQSIDITILPSSQARKRNTLSVNGTDVMFRLYPVPSYDHLFLQASHRLQEDQPYQVINMLGQHLESGVIKAGSHRSKIFTGHLAEGVYMVRFLHPAGKDVVVKFEKR